MGSAAISACAGPGKAASPAWHWHARLAAALLVVAGLQGGPALADIWAYVDERGVAHFSAQPLDERYALFFRGDGSFSVGGQALPGHSAGGTEPEAPAGVSGGAGKAQPPAGLLAFFEVSPDYKAVKHLLREASATHGIDYALLQALIATESGFDRHAVSPKGAVGPGVGQLFFDRRVAVGLHAIARSRRR